MAPVIDDWRCLSGVFDQLRPSTHAWRGPTSRTVASEITPLGAANVLEALDDEIRRAVAGVAAPIRAGRPRRRAIRSHDTAGGGPTPRS
jgi:hypothetical protein